jgi:hypothetical protein
MSPLLGNLYMRRFVLGWKRRGAESRLQAKIVSYADDYVICCKGDVDQALAEMHWMMRRLKLTVNEAKTRVSLAEGSIRLSGLQFRAVLLSADRSSVLVRVAVEEERTAPHRSDPGGDRTKGTVDGGR